MALKICFGDPISVLRLTSSESQHVTHRTRTTFYYTRFETPVVLGSEYQRVPPYGLVLRAAIGLYSITYARFEPPVVLGSE